MKQLLSTCGDYHLVGLDKTAFIFSITSSSTACELSLPPPADKQQQEGGGDPNQIKSEDPDEVQSVDLHQSATDADEYWCAVSRGDKRIAIYQWNAASQAKDKKLDAKLVYSASKRAVHMCFATVPSSSKADSGEGGTLCLVAGDLAGDAYAYSLTTQKSKLLLGHTASMLTGVAVQGNRILTADRDEKVRVSRFPQTYLIEGYLLGHTKYITSIDTLVLENSSKLHLVATCGADSTIRLWNLETLEQLSEIECPKDEKDDSSLIPIKIALHPKGTMAAVIYDKSDRFDVYSIESSSSDGAKTANLVGHLHTTKCATPLLSVLFKDADTLLTLQKEPNYLIAFEVTDSSLTLMEDATSTICQKASELSITLPEAILERDNWGNIKLEKLNETRGPASEDAPWNRFERVGIAKERQKRHKKRKLEKKDVEKKE
ncbi:unnamed protein product [Cylindrotheca closterium]|uniref:WD repeat-containing protein 4 homolog n=1 Tax=Cylindrotheca closterium TaxID=2856 RepID=A0AAD2CAI1_9STRA|nr:unnamed protein product [Cylindrotheca closterium]